MSIAQIRAHTRLVPQGPASLGGQREVLAEHRARLAATIEAWQAALALIDAKLGCCAERIETGRQPLAESAARKDVAARRAAKTRAGGR